MRITTIAYQGQHRIAVHQQGDEWAVAPQPGDLGAALCGQALPTVDDRWLACSREQFELLAPLPHPRRNIVCLGLNYADHAAESQRAKGDEWQLPSDPVVFTKATTTVTGPFADIVLDPSVTEQLDWEVELAVVIGRGGRHIPVESAMAHIFGYTVINDLSARDLQFRHKQFFLGKSLDGSCPMGPWIVTADELVDPRQLNLTCTVNDVVKQQGNTADMVFPLPTVIATLSRVFTLLPGDIIATGTPAGVGFARRPEEFLRCGDIVDCAVDGIGSIRNRLVPPQPLS